MDDRSFHDRLRSLLHRWLELREAGKTVSAEDLLREAGLWPVGERHLDLLKRLNEEIRAWLDDSAASDSGDDRVGDTALWGPPGSGGGGAPGGTGGSPPPRETASGGEGGPRYRPVRSLGQGTYGEVWVAHDTELGRDVALKILHKPSVGEIDEAKERRRRAFREEARITARLEHPFIVPVHDLCDHEEDRPCYAMRFVRKSSLQAAIARFHQTDWSKLAPEAKAREFRELLDHFLAVCNGVDYAHGQGVLHRDLKPDNVMVDRHAVTLIVDWGQARPFDRAGAESLAEPSLRPEPFLNAAVERTTISGTPSYMSPEQALWNLENQRVPGLSDVDDSLRKQLGPASDIYSLGAILYVLLTGRRRFGDAGWTEIMTAAVRGSFQKPRDVRPDVHPALQAICIKALSLRPEDRYSSARDLADDVKRWQEGERVNAYPEPIVKKIGRWLRKHPRSVSGATAFICTAFLASVIGLLVVRKERNNLQTALEDLKIAREQVQENLETAQRETRRADIMRKSVINQLKTSVNMNLDGITQSLARSKPLGANPSNEEILNFLKPTALLAYRTDATIIIAVATADAGAYDDSLNFFDIAGSAYKKAGFTRKSPLGLGDMVAVTECNATWFRAMIFEQMGRYDEARKEWDVAIQLAGGPFYSVGDFFRVCSTLAGARGDGAALDGVDLGDYSRANEQVETFARLIPAPGLTLNQMAVVRSASIFAVRRDKRLAPVRRKDEELKHAARAVELLDQARRQGFFKPTERVERLKTDPIFEPLRSRDDFRKLLKEVESG